MNRERGAPRSGDRSDSGVELGDNTERSIHHNFTGAKP